MSQPVRPLFDDVFPGWEITTEEVEFGQAMRRFQVKHRRRYPPWSEVLQVLLSLGYRRVAKPDPLPEAPPCSASPASDRSCRPAA